MPTEQEFITTKAPYCATDEDLTEISGGPTAALSVAPVADPEPPQLPAHECKLASQSARIVNCTGVWLVRAQTNRRLLCIWTSVYTVDWRNTETDEFGHEKPVEHVSRCRVMVRRTAGSVPIVVSKTGRSSWYRWETIRKFQKKNGFIAARVEARQLDSQSIALFGAPWNQLSYQQCLETLCEIGRQP